MRPYPALGSSTRFVDSRRGHELARVFVWGEEAVGVDGGTRLRACAEFALSPSWVFMRKGWLNFSGRPRVLENHRSKSHIPFLFRCHIGGRLRVPPLTQARPEKIAMANCFPRLFSPRPAPFGWWDMGFRTCSSLLRASSICLFPIPTISELLWTLTSWHTSPLPTSPSSWNAASGEGRELNASLIRYARYCVHTSP